MLKKITSIILSIAMLMTGISVFAAVDTSTDGLTIYTDNFDQFTTDETRRNGSVGYPKDAEESHVFAYSSYSTNYGSSFIDADAGIDGKTALVVGNRGTDISLMTRGMNTTGSNLYELSYDIKFNKLSTMDVGGNSMWNTSKPVFKFTAEGTVQASTDGTNYVDAGTYSADVWYDVTIVLSGTTKQAWLSDANGNTVYSKITESTSASKQLSTLFIGGGPASTTTGTIDNAVIKEYDLTKFAPVVKSISIADATDVPVDTNSATVVFSQPVSGTAKITGGAAAINCTMTLASATPDSYTYTVSWTGALAPETTYTLDLSAVKNAGALAAASSTATFTTVAQAVVKESDGFETGSFQSSYGYLSSILSMGNWTHGTTSQVDGFTGKALQIATGSTQSRVNALATTKAYTPTANKSFVVTYRLNMKDFADGLCRVYMGADSDGDGYLPQNNAVATIIDIDNKPHIMSIGANISTAYELDLDTWYDIIWSIDGAKHNISLIDSRTGEILWTGVEKTYSFNNYYIIPLTNDCYSDATFGLINQAQTFVLDDFTIWTVRKDKDLVLTESTVSDSFGLDGKVSLTFNQPVLGTPAMYSLYQGLANNKEAYSDIKVNCKNFCTQEISFSALNYETAYTLDYSGIAAASTADLGDSTAASVISFTTENSPFDAVITGDVNVSGVEAGDTIGFNLSSKVDGTALVIAALYKDSIEDGLAGFAVNPSVALSEGDSVPVTVTLPKDYDANIIKLYVWTGATFAPLMPEYILLAD